MQGVGCCHGDTAVALLIVVQCLLSICAVGVLVELATEAHGLVCVLPFYSMANWLFPPHLSHTCLATTTSCYPYHKHQLLL